MKYYFITYETLERGQWVKINTTIKTHPVEWIIKDKTIYSRISTLLFYTEITKALYEKHQGLRKL